MNCCGPIYTNKCAALEVNCHNCNKRGHFARFCREKQVKFINYNGDTEQSYQIHF